MLPLGQALRGRDSEPMDEQRLGVLAARVELLDEEIGARADGHDLECHHVELAALPRLEIVREAESLAIGLAREREAQPLLDLAARGERARRERRGLEDHEVRPVALAGEVAVDRAWREPSLALGFLLQRQP